MNLFKQQLVDHQSAEQGASVGIHQEMQAVDEENALMVRARRSGRLHKVAIPATGLCPMGN